MPRTAAGPARFEASAGRRWLAASGRPGATGGARGRRASATLPTRSSPPLATAI